METIKDWVRRAGGPGRDKASKDEANKMWLPKGTENGMPCQFCEMPEPIKNYIPPKGTKFVCSRCTCRFAAMSQEQLKSGIAYLKANRERFCIYNFEAIDNKIEALKMFAENITDDPRKPTTKKRGRHFNRKGIVRSVRDKEKRIGRSKIPV